MLEAEAKTVEHSLSRVGYMKFTQKVRQGEGSSLLVGTRAAGGYL